MVTKDGAKAKENHRSSPEKAKNECDTIKSSKNKTEKEKLL